MTKKIIVKNKTHEFIVATKNSVVNVLFQINHHTLNETKKKLIVSLIKFFFLFLK